MDSFVEWIVFWEDEQDDEGHIDMMRGAVRGVVEGVEDGQNQTFNISAGEDIGSEVIVFMQQKVEEEGGLVILQVYVQGLVQCSKL